MNRSDMVAILAEKVKFSRKDVELILTECNNLTIETLAKGEKVAFSGFGTFELRSRAAHTGRDPRTGEPIQVAETNTVAFRPGKALKAAITKE
ncbi:MAG: HU family DNA-binding protein [Ruminococcaceae bacterium]|nr:HU family DNA-binding protein [Oscillospiraceae bacterium]